MKVNYSIPDDLSEIKLKDYQSYVSVTKDNEDDNFLTLKMVEIFCHLKLDIVNRLPLLDVEKIVEVMTKVFNQKPKLQTTFILNGVKYGLIPNMEQITAGEFADIAEFLQDVSDWHKFMAVMYRPITVNKNELYLIEEYDSNKLRDFEMKELNLDVVLPATLFFWTLGKALLKATLPYLQKELKMTASKDNLTINGDGMGTFTPLQMEDFSKLMKLQSEDFLSALPF